MIYSREGNCKVHQTVIWVFILTMISFCFQAASAGIQSVSAEGSATQDPYAWSNVPIGGGGYVTGLVAHPKEQGLVYIRTDVGGLYRWNELTKTWKQLIGFADRSEVNLYGVDSIAIDPNNTDVLYAALGKYDYLTPSDIFKSSDRGETWSRTNLKADGVDVAMHANGPARTVERITVDPNDSNVVYYGSRTKGLFLSTTAANSGSWTKVQSFPAFTDTSKSGITFIVFDPNTGGNGQRSQTIYAGAYNSGVYVSQDSGVTWTLLQGSPLKPNRAVIDSDGKLYVTHGTGLARFEGSSWTNLTPPADAGQIFGGISIDPNNKNVIMTARKISNHGNPIYRSTDRGVTWTKVTYNRNIQTPWMPDWHWSSDTSSLVIDPFDSNRVWFTDWYYPWRTEDITASPSLWTNYAKGLETTVNVSNLVSPPGGNTVLHSGIADNGGFDHSSLTEFPASTYFTGTGDLSLMTTTGIDIQETNPNFVVRVGSYGWNGDNRPDPGIGGYSLNGGQSYTAFPKKPYASVQGGKVAVSASNPDSIIWMPQRSDIYYTLDRGQSWQKSVGAPSGLMTGDNIFGNYYQPISSDKVNGSFFYLYDKSGKFYRSTNGGISWIQTSALPEQATAWHTVQAAPGIMGEVWVSLNDQGLYRSGDAGNTFAKVAGVETAFLFSFGQHAPGRLNPAVFVYGKVAGYPKEAVFRSDDMGQSWVKVSLEGSFPGNDPNAMVGDRQVHGRVYIGTNGTGLVYGARLEAVTPPSFTDHNDPLPPAELTVRGARKTSVDFTWSPAVDIGNSGIMGYKVSYGDGQHIADTYGTSYSVSNLEENTAYSFKVQAIDYAGNLSDFSPTVTGMTQGGVDTTPPTVPTGLHVVQSAAFQISLTWAHNPEADLLGYNLHRGLTPGFTPSDSNRIATLLTANHFTDWSQIEANKTYYYKLQAVDVSKLVSGYSSEIVAHTPVDDRLEMIVDNLDTGFQMDSPWLISQYSASRFGTNYFHDGNVAGKWAKWTPYMTVPGEYNVYMIWNSVGSRGYNVPLEIAYDGGVDTSKKIHQTANDNRWVYIGTYSFSSNANQYLKMTTNGTATTIADAVKFTLASKDPYGGMTHENRTVSSDVVPPVIQLDQMDSTVSGSVYTLTGRTSKGVTLTVTNNGNSISTPYSSNYVNVFHLSIPLVEGTNNVWIKATDRAGNQTTASLSLHAVQPEVQVTSVTLETYGVPAVVKVGDSFRMTASVSPVNATNKMITFVSSHLEVVTVTDAVYHPEEGRTSMLVTAVGLGLAEITANSVDGHGSDIYSITVAADDLPHTDTTPPGEVTNAQVIAGNRQLTLVWSDPLDSDLVSVRITGSGTTVTDVVYAVPGQQSVTISGLENGIVYTFRVTTQDTSGNRSEGVIVSGTPRLASKPNPDPDPDPDPEPNTGPDSNGLSVPEVSAVRTKTAESVEQGVLTITPTLQSDGKAILVLRAEDMRTAIEQAASLSGSVIIDVTTSDHAKELDIEIPTRFLNKETLGRLRTLKVHTSFAVVSIPVELFSQKGAAPLKVKLLITKGEPAMLGMSVQEMAEASIYGFSLSMDDKPITEFGGQPVEVEIGYSLGSGEVPHKVVVYEVDTSGHIKILKEGRYDVSTQKALFKPKHFSMYAAAYHDVAFTDLTNFDWAVESIEALAAREALSGMGDGRFYPEGIITRAEFINMLMNTFDLTDLEASSTLTDVEKGSWYSKAVATAQALSIVLGKEDGSLGVHEQITRQDMAVIIYRLVQQLKLELGDGGTVPTFADQHDFASYASESILYLQQKGIVNGLSNGRFVPLDPSTRAQAAAIVYRLFTSK